MEFLISAPCLAVNAACLDACIAGCIHIDSISPQTARRLYVNPALCLECDNCVLACPMKPVTMRETQRVSSPPQ